MTASIFLLFFKGWGDGQASSYLKRKILIKKEIKEREGWPPPFLIFFLKGAGDMTTSILLYYSSLGRWGDGHMHSHYSSLRGGKMATSIPTILPQGAIKIPKGKSLRESP